MKRLVHGILTALGTGAMFLSMVEHPKVAPYRDALAWLGYGLGLTAQTGHFVPQRWRKAKP